MDRELVILSAISEALNRSIDLDQSLRTTLAKVAELLDLKTGWVFNTVVRALETVADALG